MLDLGCGNGRYTLASALARPDHDHFSIDVLPVVIRYATRRANQRGLANVRFAVKDAQTFLASYVGRWNDRRDPPLSSPTVSRRQEGTSPRPDAANARPRPLAPWSPSGLFVVQTDNPDYWRYMCDVLPSLFDFQEVAGPWPDSPEGRTRREIIARQRGLTIYRGIATRRDDLTAETVTTIAQLASPSRPSAPAAPGATSITKREEHDANLGHRQNSPAPVIAPYPSVREPASFQRHLRHLRHSRGRTNRKLASHSILASQPDMLHGPTAN